MKTAFDKVIPALILISLTACGNPLSQTPGSEIHPDYHPGLPTAQASTTPALPFGGVGGIKITPGAVAAAGASTAAAVSVTVTNRKLAGAHLGGKISVSKVQAR